MEPSGSGLMAAAPPGPVQVVPDCLPGAGEQVVQAPDLCDGERDQAGICGWLLVRASRRGRLGAGGRPGVGGSDGADGEGGHRQNEVAVQGGVGANLGLIEPEMSFDRPAAARDADQGGEAGGPPWRHVTVEERQVSGGVAEVAAD